MKLHRYLLGLLVTGALLISPANVIGHYDASRPEAYSSSGMDEMTTETWIYKYTDETIPPGPVQLASVDLCYKGSIVDPATGEIVDLFAHCTDDAIGGNFDLA